MEDVTRRAETSLSKFSYALDQLEQTIRPVLKAIDELRASGAEDDLDAMSRARMHISLSYAVNALFCMYLRTQGVNPATHPVSEDIARVQDAFMRMRRVEAGIAVDHQPMPDRDRRRYIVNAKKSAQKLASLVFPEEVDLLNAIRGKKRKRETDGGGKEKKARTEGKTSLPEGADLDSSEIGNDTGRESGQSEDDALQSGRGGTHASNGTETADKVTKTRTTSDMLDTTDSSSEEENGVKAYEEQENRKGGEAVSAEEDVSGKKKKKKKKKKDKSKSKDSKTDSKRERSKDKKDKTERTSKESERSEEKRKRKRKKKTEKKRKSRPEQ